jgi:hypothetical protein
MNYLMTTSYNAITYKNLARLMLILKCPSGSETKQTKATEKISQGEPRRTSKDKKRLLIDTEV